MAKRQTSYRSNKAKVLAEQERKLQRGLDRFNALVVSEAQQELTPGHGKKTGNLQRALTFLPSRREGRRIVGVVGARRTAPYALAVHEGSRPHIIKPRRAKLLVFKVGDQRVVARAVKHPGTKPIPFLRLGLRRAKPRAVELITGGR